MRVVARPDALTRIREHGTLYVWPRAYRCCRGRQYVLEASLDAPEGDFEIVYAVDGFRVYATPGLATPDELHLDLDPKGRVRAFWNGQGWIG
jgi:hypothetical protein